MFLGVLPNILYCCRLAMFLYIFSVSLGCFSKTILIACTWNWQKALDRLSGVIWLCKALKLR